MVVVAGRGDGERVRAVRVRNDVARDVVARLTCHKKFQSLRVLSHIIGDVSYRHGCSRPTPPTPDGASCRASGAVRGERKIVTGKIVDDAWQSTRHRSRSGLGA